MSFFTRNLARLAPSVVALLQQHGQAMDPNLVRLAEAYEVAAAKLTGAGEQQDMTGQGAAQAQPNEASSVQTQVPAAPANCRHGFAVTTYGSASQQTHVAGTTYAAPQSKRTKAEQPPQKQHAGHGILGPPKAALDAQLASASDYSNSAVRSICPAAAVYDDVVSA